MVSHSFTVQMRRAALLQVVSLRFLLAVCLLMSASEDTAEKAAGRHPRGWAGRHTTGSAANARDRDPAPGFSKYRCLLVVSCKQWAFYIRA